MLPLVAAAAFAPWAARAAISPPSIAGALARLDILARQDLQRTGVPGMAIAVVHHDQVVYLKGFGISRVGDPAPVDEDTVFPLASLSKPLASTVVAALVGDGVVTWDDPLVRHDPGFRMHEPWVTDQVTLRDMFAHRSGLPDHAGDLLEDIGYDRDAVLHRLRHQKPGSSFRSRYAYTNFGVTAAAVAAAKAAGTSWEDLAAERLYRRLGMRRTSSRFADYAATANHARGHVRRDGAWVAGRVRQPDAQSPAGGVTSSARDMAAWLRLQLGRGRLDGVQVVATAALDETHFPQIVRARSPGGPEVARAGFYGLGWNVDHDPAGRLRLGHSGAFNLGAATCVSLVPGERLGIVVLTNAQPVGLPEAICRSFLDAALDVRAGESPDGRDWLALYGQLFATAMAPDYRMPAAAALPPSPPLPLAAYAGRYANDLFGPAEIALSAAGLLLSYGRTPVRFPLRPFDRDIFAYQPEGEGAFGPSAITFTVGVEGKATAMTIQNLDGGGQGLFIRSANPG